MRQRITTLTFFAPLNHLAECASALRCGPSCASAPKFSDSWVSALTKRRIPCATKSERPKGRDLPPEAARLAGNIRIAIQQWPKKSPKDQAVERRFILRDIDKLTAMLAEHG